MTLNLGIDVGGTFTDLFLYDSQSTRSWSAKTPTTPANQAVGVMTGVLEVCARAGVAPASLDAVLHGTTVTTNALLEGKGSRVGLLTSYGWRNILHLADSWTPGPLFGFFSYTPPEPVVPHERIRELQERVAADGEVILALCDADVEERVNELLATGIEALTICLHHSYAFPEHEQRAGAVARRVLERAGSTIPVSLSSQVSPEFREYERTVTTVLNSYLGPVMRRYLSSLESALARVPVAASLQVVRSDGGLMSVGAAQEHPVSTALSGPSGGVNGAAFIASRAGFDRILTFDMGGTSSDVAVCRDGVPTVTRETRVAAFPVRAPAISVETIGAGGGSIANVSEVTGGLRVGPESAGADPGPACYGRGGTLPTVSDANVLLGHLPPVLLGGGMTLDVSAAADTFAPLAKALDVDLHRAARAVIDIVNGNMLGALRVATVQKGLNPRDHALVSFGGAGGLHANALAAALGSFPVLVPPEPGVLSALGFVVADVRNEFAKAQLTSLPTADLATLWADLLQLAELATGWLEDERVPAERQEVTHVLDMRYHRQGYEIAVEFGPEVVSASREQLERRFHEQHQQVYGFVLPADVEVVTIRARAVGRTEKVHTAERPLGGADSSAAVVDMQRSYVDGTSVDIPIYDRELLEPGMTMRGKAIVRQYDSTVLVLPDHEARVDGFLNLLIDEAR